jgi:hypothetical protein
MELEKYKNDGWGLNEEQFNTLLKIIKNYEKPHLRVVEFGSGKSTEFLCDINESGIKKLEIVSFDDNEEFAYNGSHNCLDLKIRKLTECSDVDYNKMFSCKGIVKEYLKDKVTPLTSRQRNNFYDIREGDLSGIYDLMILDGPNGNGRNIGYLYIKNHLDIESIVLVDDYTHYDFMEKLSLFFEYEILHQKRTLTNKLWSGGGDYTIVKIKKILI